jgi:hypothetical protein
VFLKKNWDSNRKRRRKDEKFGKLKEKISKRYKIKKERKGKKYRT